MNGFELMRLLYDATILLYAVSLTLLFSDVLQPRRTVNRVAVMLLFTAFLTVTGMLFVRFQSFHQIPAYTKSDLMLFISWLMLVITLVLDTFLRVRFILFFANVVSFSMVLFAGYRQGSDVLNWFPNQDLLLVHIALALLAETAFAFGYVFAVMHVVQEGNLRHKKWNRWFMLLPSLTRLDMYSFSMCGIGFLLLAVAMPIGDVWSKLVLGHWMVWSAKPVVTFVTWLMYGVFLWVRFRSTTAGRTLMFYQMICFAATVFNLVVIGNHSPEHIQH